MLTSHFDVRSVGTKVGVTSVLHVAMQLGLYHPVTTKHDRSGV